MTQKSARVVLITGPSGAGRSTAVNTLEDIGFETIDNLPLALLPRLLAGPELKRDLAIAVDVRTRDFSPKGVMDALDALEEREDIEASLFYLDCSSEVLLRRYSETRRRHPSAPEGAPDAGIGIEKDLLQILRRRADVYVDTTEFTPHNLRDEVNKLFGTATARLLAVNLSSFSYKRGVPRGIDMVFDCRFLRNPYWDESLRSQTGQNEGVIAFVQADPRYAEFFDRIVGLTEMLLPAYKEEGKAHFTIGLGCTGGRHRSVCLTDALGGALMERGWQVAIRHRELERSAAMAQIKRS